LGVFLIHRNTNVWGPAVSGSVRTRACGLKALPTGCCPKTPPSLRLTSAHPDCAVSRVCAAPTAGRCLAAFPTVSARSRHRLRSVSRAAASRQPRSPLSRRAAARALRPCRPSRVAGECRRHRRSPCHCPCRSAPRPWVRCASAGRAAELCRRLGHACAMGARPDIRAQRGFGPLAGSTQRGHGTPPAWLWAVHTPCKLVVPALCNWAVADSA
jgi:hypothetical protein